MTLAYYGKSRQRQALLAIVTFFAIAIGVVVGGGFGGLFPAARILANGDSADPFNSVGLPVSNQGVVPTVPNGGTQSPTNPSCNEQNASWLEFSPNSGALNVADVVGTQQFHDGVSGRWVKISNVQLVTVNLNPSIEFDWESNFSVLGVIVKQASDRHNLYSYPSGDTQDGGLGPQPGHSNSNATSHLAFCYTDGTVIQPNPTIAKSVGDGNSQTSDVMDTIIGNDVFFNITVTSTATVPQSVQILDAGATFMWVVAPAGGTCAGEFQGSGSPFDCTVNAGGTLKILVKKTFDTTTTYFPNGVCSPGSIKNKASVLLAGGAAPVPLGDTNEVTVALDAPGTECDPQILAPSITKAAVSGQASGGFATWEISVQNAGNAALPVVVNDSGATFGAQTSTGATGSCTDIADDSAPFNCTVNAVSTLKFTVKKAVTNATCAPTQIDNQASVSWWNGESSQTSSLTASAVVQIPVTRTDCDPSVPTISKSAGSFNTVNDTATWTITINNAGANAISRNIVVTDAGATLTGVSGGGSCSNALPSGSPFNCTVGAGGTLTLTVTRVIGRACQPGSVTNTASAAIVDGAALGNSPASAPALAIPADTSLCGVPTVTKTGGSFNATTDIATWTITISNTGANAISRNIVVTDAGAALTGVSGGGSCSNALPSGSPFSCTVGAGGTLTLTVTRVIGQACQPGSVTNTASVTIAGQNIGGSPVTSASLSIPSDGSLCPLTPTPTPTLPALILDIPTPTPTTVPPTATPAPPTATPKPTEKPKPTDTPIDAALGEKTPGALSTPIAPSTGTGTAGTASTFNGLLALVGLVVLGSGLAIVAVGRKQR